MGEVRGTVDPVCRSVGNGIPAEYQVGAFLHPCENHLLKAEERILQIVRGLIGIADVRIARAIKGKRGICAKVGGFVDCFMIPTRAIIVGILQCPVYWITVADVGALFFVEFKRRIRCYIDREICVFQIPASFTEVGILEGTIAVVADVRIVRPIQGQRAVLAYGSSPSFYRVYLSETPSHGSLLRVL
jgi:hypothetical protein